MSDERVWLTAVGEPHFTKHLSPWSTGRIQYECGAVSDREGDYWQEEIYLYKTNTGVLLIG